MSSTGFRLKIKCLCSILIILTCHISTVLIVLVSVELNTPAESFSHFFKRIRKDLYMNLD